MSLLTLGAKHGNTMELVIDGLDEAKAMIEMKQVISEQIQLNI